MICSCGRPTGERWCARCEFALAMAQGRYLTLAEARAIIAAEQDAERVRRYEAEVESKEQSTE